MLQRISPVALALLIAVHCGASGVFFDTGPTMPVSNGNNGANATYIGYAAGSLNSGAKPNRWTAVPVVVPSGGVSINHIEILWLAYPGYESKDVRLKVLSRTGLSSPNSAGNALADILLGPYGAGTDDPRINWVDDWLHVYDLAEPLVLAAGNYWFVPYGSGDVDPGFPTANHAIAHFAGCWGAGENLGLEQNPTGPFPNGYFLRSDIWPTPGFAANNAAGTIGPIAGFQLENVDTWNFNLLLSGTGIFSGGTISGTAHLSDIDDLPYMDWDFFVAEIRNSSNAVLKYQPFVLQNASSTHSGNIYSAPYTLNYYVPGYEGPYNIRIRGGTFLAKTIVPGDPTDLTFVNGDWDQDNELTLVDFGAVAAVFGAAVGDANWDPFADFNLDGEVNIIDIAIIALNFGLAGDE